MTPDSDELPTLRESEEQRLRELLMNAFAPGEIDPHRHERLLQAALEDPFAPASPEEMVASDRLRRALDGDGDSVDAALARALAAAHAPAALRAEVALPASPPKAKVIYVAFGGLGAALAAAAALLLLVTTRESHDASSQLEAVALVQSRSTAALFQADAAGDPSSRIDRIASARSRDLRDNRYALWGVK